MELYKKAVALWQRKKISNDAELAVVLNSQKIAFAYKSGKIENDRVTKRRSSKNKKRVA